MSDCNIDNSNKPEDTENKRNRKQNTSEYSNKGQEQTLQSHLVSLSHIFKKYEADTSYKKIPFKKIEKAILSLFSHVMWADGKFNEEEKEVFSNFFIDKYSDEEIENFFNIIRYKKGYSVEEAAKIIKNNLLLAEQKAIVLALIETAVADKIYSEHQKNAVKEICQILEFDNLIIKELEDAYFNKHNTKKNFLSSGGGIIAALVVIGIFILTATFLKSVLFGLVLAYFFLPVQSWFQEKFFRLPVIKNIMQLGYTVSSAIAGFSKQIINKIKHSEEKEILTDEELQKIKLLKEVRAACHATVLFAFLIFILLFSGFIGIIISYIIGMGSDIKHWADRTIYSVKIEKEISPDNKTGKNENPPTSENTSLTLPLKTNESDTPPSRQTQTITHRYKQYAFSFMNAWIQKIDNYGKKLERIPGFRLLREKAIHYLKDKKTQENIAALTVKASGGLFSYTADIVGSTANLVFNFVLTVFFFVFFLQKMAEAKTEINLSTGPGEYLINILYGSRWLPTMSKHNREEAKEILNNIFFKLKTWVRGYISIILIETTIYVTVFFLLRIPYPYIVGAIAGCTVLLPFIGPIVSMLITIIVYLAFTQHFSLFILLSIIITYLIMNGIIEQLFLYPALVGNALGLNTLETIIVVLLGGLFAGIAGMIFALPAAAVIKYLVPKIYRNWSD